MTWAERADDDELLADVRATLGVTLVAAGHPRRGLSQLDLAIAVRPTPRALAARAYALVLHGRYEAAYRDTVRRSTASVGAGTSSGRHAPLHNLGWTEMSWGRLDEAEEHTRAAAELLAPSASELEALWAEQNLGEIAYARGDLPAALRVLRGGVRRVRPARRSPRAPRHGARADLPGRRPRRGGGRGGPEALARADVMPHGPRRSWSSGASRLSSTPQSLDQAVDSARMAARTSAAGDDDWFETRARLVVVRACARRGDRGRRLAAEAAAVADVLDARGPTRHRSR